MVRIGVKLPAVPEYFREFKLYFFVQEKVAEIHADERKNYCGQCYQEQ